VVEALPGLVYDGSNECGTTSYLVFGAKPVIRTLIQLRADHSSRTWSLGRA